MAAPDTLRYAKIPPHPTDLVGDDQDPRDERG